MKIVAILGIVLFLLGGLALLIGVVVCINTWTSDYATAECEKAEADRKAFAEARVRCGSTSSECYKQATIGLTSQEDCDARTAFMNRQMLMGAIPAVIGLLLGIAGLIMAIGGFFVARKKAAAAS